jgi:hypothetical protein
MEIFQDTHQLLSAAVDYFHSSQDALSINVPTDTARPNDPAPLSRSIDPAVQRHLPSNGLPHPVPSSEAGFR